MSDDVHVRAQKLILRSNVEGLGASDLSWLDAHLSSCPECERRAAATEEAIQAIRSVSVRVDPALVEAARRRVHRRARELERGRLPGTWFWLASAASWLWIAASFSFLWRGFGWVAARVGIPSPFWQMGFALWWAVPALVLVAALSVRSLQEPAPMES